MRKPLLLLLLAALPSQSLWAWGERGHALVTRVAIRLLASSPDPELCAFGEALQKRELMLAHLSNVPDIAWRSDDQSTREANAPSHYIDLEFLSADPTRELRIKPILSWQDYSARLSRSCDQAKESCAPGATLREKAQKTGHAPFRVEQLFREMQGHLQELAQLDKQASTDKDRRNALLEQSLLKAGLLSHFVGDLANPHHTTKDYDGWETGQGGLHRYFETDLLDVYTLNLEYEVWQRAKQQKPALALMTSRQSAALPRAMELALASHERLAKLQELDKKVSWLEKSQIEGRKEAKRRSPKEALPQYREFLLERLAFGADALAHFWREAWQQAGRPKLPDGRIPYPLQPAFVPLGYGEWQSPPAPRSGSTTP